MNPVSELKKIAKSVIDFDPVIAKEVIDVAIEAKKEGFDKDSDLAEELNDVIDGLESIEDGVRKNIDKTVKEVQDVADELIASKKEASLINEGDKIVCLNPIQGLFKGRIYFAGETLEPNYRVIYEDDNTTEVGLFRVDRFCLYNKEN